MSLLSLCQPDEHGDLGGFLDQLHQLFCGENCFTDSYGAVSLQRGHKNGRVSESVDDCFCRLLASIGTARDERNLPELTLCLNRQCRNLFSQCRPCRSPWRVDVNDAVDLRPNPV